MPERMRCQHCGRELTADEPVYRVAIGYDFVIWRDRWDGHTVGSLCAYCATQSRDAISFSDQRWRAPEPCCHCGRPVILNGRRRVPRFIACGDRCRRAAAQWEISPSERACPACGVIFTPNRINKTYCSRACLQWAYRTRKGDADRPPSQRRTRWPSERACPACGVIFRPKSNTATYCSRGCREWAYRNRRDRGGRARAGGTHDHLHPPGTEQD